MLGAAEAFQRAQAALADGKPDEAARLFRLVSEQAENDAASLIHLGQIETSLGHPRAAKEAWQKALLRQPSNASVFTALQTGKRAGCRTAALSITAATSGLRVGQVDDETVALVGDPDLAAQS